MSALLPGLGQIYNETYWKVPIIWGLGGYWVYEWIRLNEKYQDYGDRFAANPTAPDGSQLKRIRDFYRDERDRFAWYLGALYFVNLLDAYVGANLYDFSVGDDFNGIRFTVQPARLSLRIEF